MTKMKTVALSLALVSLISFSLTASAEGADVQTSNAPLTGFTAPKQLSPSEIEELNRTAIKVIPSQTTPSKGNGKGTSPSTAGTLADYNLSYNIQNLNAGNHITSINDLYRGSTGTVNLTVVQWNTGLGTAKVGYRLARADGYRTDLITLEGNYTSNNVTVHFNNVLPGSYNLEITNLNTVSAIQGNGYTS